MQTYRWENLDNGNGMYKAPCKPQRRHKNHNYRVREGSILQGLILLALLLIAIYGTMFMGILIGGF